MEKVKIGRISLTLALVLLGLLLGLWGIRWGLPGPERLSRIMPPGLDSPPFRARLADSWAAMHRELGDNLISNPKAFASFTGIVETPAGWTAPPDVLLNSYRSFYLRSEHEDEQSVLLDLSRMKPWKLEFHAHHFTYGALHLYSVGAAIALGALVKILVLKSSVLVYLDEPARIAGLYLAGRLVSVAAYIAGALLLFGFGRRRVGFEAGAFGAAIYLMTPAAVVQAHVLKNHAYWSALAVWAVERSARVLERGRWRDYAAAGAVAGLATVTFLGAWPACLVVGAAGAMRILGLHAPQGRRCDPMPELKGLVIAGLCALAAFVIVSPYWLLDYREAMMEMKVLSGFGARDWTHPFLFAATALRRAVTDPILVLMFGGAALALLKGRRDPVLLLCAVAFLLGLASMATVGAVTSTRQVRYFLGWAAIGSLLAGRLIQELRALKGTAGRLGTVTAIIVLAGLFCQGLSYAHNFHLGESDRSNHFLAGAWIERNVPPGETIGLVRLPQPSNSPFFRYDRYRLRFIEANRLHDLPEKLQPRYLALTVPDYDDRPAATAILSRYERLAVFPRAKLFPWIEIDPTATTANPLIEIYGLKQKGA